jgi:hypothetical protein
MSVLIPNDEVFNYLCSGLERAAYTRTCDEWWSHRIHSHFKDKDIETESRRLVESWMQLNDWSYSFKYGEEVETQIKLRRKTLHKPMQVHQLLKYAQCVDYNIEKDTIECAGNKLTKQGKSDLWLLRQWILDIAMSIIGQIPEYKEAKWSS